MLDSLGFIDRVVMIMFTSAWRYCIEAVTLISLLGLEILKAYQRMIS